MQRRDIALLSIGTLVLVLTLVLFLVVFGKQATTSESAVPGSTDIGGQFQLVDSDGSLVSQDDFLGKPTIMFFGFTYCSDICPSTLFNLSRLIKQLGNQADQFNYFFVSLDWQRDGPDQLSRYLSVFDSRIHGLSGNEAQIDAIAETYRVHYERVETDNGDYTISHTASTYLLDPEGNFVGTLAYDFDLDEAQASLEQLLASS
ncbi:hypothetical protein LCGC14_0107990 [marine sediment metagenome]|uniref:Thioredoxin domain-containing protein n=1 Tax=marine sediment metagenome TaxID=412755 RepID=A0A0F9YD47_9ZZZZ|nr:SCO family protein [Halomonas sp.]HDZ47704.1 SCO family protein [Halomonas sp.]HEB06513.1 SCO family protein [Halomonas sp.]